MVFPSVLAVFSTIGSASATPGVGLPNQLSAGDLVLVLFRTTDGSAGVAWPAGFTELGESTADASNDATSIACRRVDGTEGWGGSGNLITLATANAQFLALAWRISGAEDPAVQLPELSAVAVGTNTAADASVCTPTGGAKDYLWLILGGYDGVAASPPGTPPPGYSNVQATLTFGGWPTAMWLFGAERSSHGASEDPGVWTIGTPQAGWTAWTLAVHPAPTAAAAAEAQASARFRHRFVASSKRETALVLHRPAQPAIPRAQGILEA